MVGVITSEKSGSFERMDMKLYIWMRSGLIRIMLLTKCGYQLINGKGFLKLDFFIKLFFSFKGLKRNVVF
jgi:hypothetical protein